MKSSLLCIRDADVVAVDARKKRECSIHQRRRVDVVRHCSSKVGHRGSLVDEASVVDDEAVTYHVGDGCRSGGGG